MSPGLQRARAPYFVRNAITGFVLGAFGIGVYAYSISAVKQDIFDDVDEEARAMASAGRTTEPGGSVPAKVVPGEEKFALAITPKVVEEEAPLPSPQRGWKPLIQGAPPVNNMGKLGDKPLRYVRLPLEVFSTSHSHYKGDTKGVDNSPTNCGTGYLCTYIAASKKR